MEHSVSPLLRILDKDEDPSFDAFLYIGEKLVLKAHKYILSLAVPFFERSFRSGMKEAVTGEVKFPEKKVSEDTLKTLVRSVYGDKCVLDERNVRDIHDTANFLEMDEISGKCVEFMLENLKVDTVLPLWEYALTDFAGSEKLLKGCEQFITGHLLDLYENEMFLNLEVDVICAFLSSDQLCVSSENDVFDALLCWLNHDWGNRFHLIPERSLLDLIRWKSIDASVHKLPSLRHICDQDQHSVAEKDALFMIYEKVVGMPVRAKEPLTRVKGAQTTPLSSEVGSFYCLKGQGQNIKIHVYDLATKLFCDPQPLDMPEGASHVLGMISHDSRPFVVVSGGPWYNSDQCLLLLELQQGRIKSKIDLILPVEAQQDDHGYLMAAAPPNADKLCLGLRRDMSHLLVVYDLASHVLESPATEGSRGSLRSNQYISRIPSSVIYRGHRLVRVAYTPGQIWAVEYCVTSSGFNLKAFSYDLYSQCWGTSFVLTDAARQGSGSSLSAIMVISEYIAVAGGRCLTKVDDAGKKYHKSQGWVHMFKYNDPTNDKSSLQCSYVHEDTRHGLRSVCMALMGQRLLVFMRRISYGSYAFSTMVDEHGKPMGQLSRDEAMDYLDLESAFTLSIQ